MQYFDTLPKVVYTDKTLVSRVYTNIIARASFPSSLVDNPLVFYTYDIQDEDTPEIVAYKYYGDSYRYWIILYCNNITDPQWDWPLSNIQLQKYLEDKYTGNSLYDVHHYEKIITQYDVNSLTTTTNTLTIDEETYNSLVETTNTYNLPTGQVQVSVTKGSVTNYDYEISLNESKRNIKILNKNYAQQLENELKKLMSV